MTATNAKMPPQPFEIGDKVVCINAGSLPEPALVLGREYDIKWVYWNHHTRAWMIIVAVPVKRYFAKRFQLKGGTL